MSLKKYFKGPPQKKLFFVGEFSPETSALVSALCHSEQLSAFNPNLLSRQQFDSFYGNNALKIDSSFAQPYEELLVIITEQELPLDHLTIVAEQLFCISSASEQGADLFIPRFNNRQQIASAISMAFDYLDNKCQLDSMTLDMQLVTQERQDLCDIGIALSAEKDLERLLSMVLAEGRKLGNCEAASLYLLSEIEPLKRELLFKLTQNSKIDFDFKEKRFPLTSHSLAGYVALTGEVLNIADAYQLADTLPFQFDKSFDLATGYRTKQLLVLPMRNHRGKVIGVLQFINQLDVDHLQNSNKGFTSDKESLLMSLASQAAVAIDNSQLIENIQTLFEGFVAASVNAIESRDPVTSGHSFRVADFTSGLAESLDRIDSGPYKNLLFSKQQLREIRYASLLHDFGKVGVKENVLLKANKLMPDRLQYLQLKIEWQKQLMQREFYQRLVTSKNISDLESWFGSKAHQEMLAKVEKLDQFQKILLQANAPTLMEATVAKELEQLFGYRLDSSFPFEKSLLNNEDFLALSVTKGSLTELERLEIQSHVVHTESFLSQIPWTEEFAAVPIIAASHHEKLDGSGYPRGYKADEIPVASKIMAIADIYDALTASDRPYKRAVQTELALDIIKDEARAGKLCNVMVDVFIEAKIYQKFTSNQEH